MLSLNTEGFQYIEVMKGYFKQRFFTHYKSSLLGCTVKTTKLFKDITVSKRAYINKICEKLKRILNVFVFAGAGFGKTKSPSHYVTVKNNLNTLDSLFKKTFIILQIMINTIYTNYIVYDLI